jgi:hypothetical protein
MPPFKISLYDDILTYFFLAFFKIIFTCMNYDIKAEIYHICMYNGKLIIKIQKKKKTHK